MYIILIPRVGQPHIFNFAMSNGKFRMLCGKDMIPEITVNSLAGDVVFPGLCKTCAERALDMYQDDLKTDPRMARNSWQNRIEGLRDFHYQEILGPMSLSYDMEKRSWSKLAVAKRKAFQRNR